MNYYQTEQKINLLDEVMTDQGVSGTVVGFDIINNRDFVEVRGDRGKFYVSTNTIQQVRTLKVQHE